MRRLSSILYQMLLTTADLLLLKSSRHFNTAVIWTRTSSTAVYLRDRVKRKAVRLISDSLLILILQSLTYGRGFVSLIYFFFWFPVFINRRGSSPSDNFRLFSSNKVSVPNCWTLFQPMITPRTARPWNIVFSLQSFCNGKCSRQTKSYWMFFTHRPLTVSYFKLFCIIKMCFGLNVTWFGHICAKHVIIRVISNIPRSLLWQSR